LADGVENKTWITFLQAFVDHGENKTWLFFGTHAKTPAPHSLTTVSSFFVNFNICWCWWADGDLYSIHTVCHCWRIT
jgi:hypothetical protein